MVARIRGFAQPSEVQEPIELLRAGIVFHARGLLNTKAIQHNLDWIWPYWVERQFNPRDQSFIPRAFSFSHINLTHRNWTAVGQPDLPLYPIVDPHGLVTPLYDGWSIDCWFMPEDGTTVCPSRLSSVEQTLVDDTNRRIITRCTTDTLRLVTEIAVNGNYHKPVLQITARADASVNGWLIFSLRPANPEGIQFIDKAELLENQNGWLVNETTKVLWRQKPEKVLFSDYQKGDVFFHLKEPQTVTEISCSIGMITSSSFYRIEASDSQKDFTLSVPLSKTADAAAGSRLQSWLEAEKNAAQLDIPDLRIKFLYDTATRSLIHLSAGDMIPGPYTYNRFWFRDGCIMLNALLTAGMKERCRRHLDSFSKRQRRDGFFHSQDGEWDSNGQVLWIFNRYRLLSGETLNPDWLKPIIKGAQWISRKRVSETENPRVKGLLPPGFSAEHFGPNDNYYWDDFWAVGGLFAAAETMAACGREKEQRAIYREATQMKEDLLNSISLVAAGNDTLAVPASPNRRLDSAAIGTIVADYPLQLLPPGDSRMLATAGYLMGNCMLKGCFFQDMIHSGINIYMTLQLAQVYLRAADSRYKTLLENVARFASPTGQWPEAIHPLTGGGCMGDGQHGWAAAEWLMLIRNMFIMEEKNMLVIGRGIPPDWVERRKRLAYGPTLTPFGSVNVEVDCRDQSPAVKLSADWYEAKPESVLVSLPGFRPEYLSGPDYSCRVTRE